ncbi:MAG: GatB/YqeY domain-containing protein [Candidatus Paceibacterota bacterium]
MTFQEKIKEEVKNAMKAKDETRVLVLKGVLSAFTNELVATKRTPQDALSDDEALAVVTRLSKQRKDSISQIESGGRADLAENEKKELAVLEEFLPTLMSIEEIRTFAENKKSEMGVVDASQKGQFMGALMKDLKGKADGGDVKKVVDGLFA